MLYLPLCQVTGEAEYTDDTPTPPNTLHAALVLSKKAHARILSIDDSIAKSSPGFVGLFLSKDIPGTNHTGPIIHDEEVFASEVVTCVGQVSTPSSDILCTVTDLDITFSKMLYFLIFQLHISFFLLTDNWNCCS